jgi:hypothetical protein
MLNLLVGAARSCASLATETPFMTGGVGARTAVGSMLVDVASFFALFLARRLSGASAPSALEIASR